MEIKFVLGIIEGLGTLMAALAVGLVMGVSAILRRVRKQRQ